MMPAGRRFWAALTVAATLSVNFKDSRTETAAAWRSGQSPEPRNVGDSECVHWQT